MTVCKWTKGMSASFPMIFVVVWVGGDSGIGQYFFSSLSRHFLIFIFHICLYILTACNYEILTTYV